VGFHDQHIELLITEVWEKPDASAEEMLNFYSQLGTEKPRHLRKKQSDHRFSRKNLHARSTPQCYQKGQLPISMVDQTLSTGRVIFQEARAHPRAGLRSPLEARLMPQQA
jgi:hypothetical protein